MKHYSFIDYATQGYAALVAVMVLFFHNHTTPHWPWIIGVHIVILAAVHGLIQWQAKEPSLKWLDFLRHFYPVLLYVWFFHQTGGLNRMFFPEHLDPQIIRWEQALFGTQPSVWFMEKCSHLAFSELLYASYFSYYIMITGVGIALFLRNRLQFFHYLSVISFVFYVCYFIYLIVPVIGPRVFFREIAGCSLPAELQLLAPVPDYPPSIQSGPFFHIMAFIYEHLESPGAALPSSHVAIALCTLFFSFKYLRPVVWVHAILTVLLCASTIYCRYHYLIDVLAGILTAAILLPVANWLYFRYGEEGYRDRLGAGDAAATPKAPGSDQA